MQVVHGCVDSQGSRDATARSDNAETHARLDQDLLLRRPRQAPQEIPRHGRVP